jgi:hypothetical protein
VRHAPTSTTDDQGSLARSVVFAAPRSWSRCQSLSTEENPMTDVKSRWLALYVLCLGDLMIVLDSAS